MPANRRYSWTLRALSACVAVALLLLGSGLVSSSAGDLQSSISAKQSAASSLRSDIANDSAQIRATSGGLQTARQQLAVTQAELTKRETQLRQVQTSLLAARAHLLALENQLERSAHALSANLVASYEGARPDLVSVILNAHGFNDLLEQMSYIQRVGRQDAQIVKSTRVARAEVSRQADALGALETRDRSLTDQILAERNHAAALQAALLSQQIAEVGARASKTAQLGHLNSQLHTLEARAARQAQAAAEAEAGGATNGPVGGTIGSVGGLATDAGGMVQAPAGAPAAVHEVIAAGNAIATLPYIYGGGHASFQANGYDCSGSVSYALAAAGLLSSPLDSTGFESWGLPGPGRWITVYANAGHAWMTVAGWRFDTVALAEGGTRWAQGGGEFGGMVERHPPGL